jgi:flagellar assembly protein FliH
MSTSSSPAIGDSREPVAQPFSYVDAAPPHPAERAAAGGESEMLAREQVARTAGQQEGEARARVALAAQLDEVRETLRSALADFARERSLYFQNVEHEVVQLALSIARSILHREAQIDPMLLAGLVRVALEKIESSSQVSVKVCPERAEPWRAYFREKPLAGNTPAFVEDPALERDRCVIQTTMGTTEVGVETQLKEIEQGLFDLMAQRPRGNE